MCIYNIYIQVSVRIYMWVYNGNTVQTGVYLCTGLKLGKFGSGSSQTEDCEGGGFVV